MLFIDYSSAFNTIIPTKLISKLADLGLETSICSWIFDFLMGRPQVVRIGSHISSSLILNTGTPQGCVLSPLLYSLFTYDCAAKHSSNIIFNFADDMTILGLIMDNNETACRKEAVLLLLKALNSWCQDNSLSLNISKTKEMIVVYSDAEVERVSSFKVLSVNITEDLSWTLHRHSDQESSPAALFPEKTEEVWHEHQHPHKLLQVHHGEPADGLHHGLVRELFCPQQITTESGGGGTAHHRQTSPGHSEHFPPAVPAEGTQHLKGPQPPSTPTVWQTIQEHGCTQHQIQQQVLPPGHQAPQLITHTLYISLPTVCTITVYIKICTIVLTAATESH
ncbi:hypothetical protein LDENG_00179550 [Lucifuga dentata]|nr:hypothetical protein LDENG_00179550 [Lucifuga dentata]